MTVVSQLMSHAADQAVFSLLQACVLGFVAFAGFMDWLQLRRAGPGPFHAFVTRGAISMAYFVTTFTVVSGMLAALTLTFDMPIRYRVLWVLIDTALLGYLCLANRWFRNRTVLVFNWLSTRERV